MKKTFRLNRKYSSEYALFTVNDNKVKFHRFEFWGGPELECREMNLAKGRVLYAQMLTEKRQVGHHLLPSERRTTSVWMPVQQ